LKTIIIDIDGTILLHPGKLSDCYTTYWLENPSDGGDLKLPKVLEKFNDWAFKEYFIILITARKESMRAMTIQQLEDHKICYDLLIMGLPHGDRHIINDQKEDGSISCYAHSIPRNGGLTELDI
jgi:uncharacterized HAD superfamily protein